MSSLTSYASLLKGHLTYSASKAGINFSFQGIRMDLLDIPLKVSSVRIGFVDTDLVKVNDFYRLEMVSPESIAKKIVEGIFKQKKEICYPGLITIN